MAIVGMTGQGTTAVLTDAAIVGCVRGITLPTWTQDKIDASCLDTTGFMRYIPSDLTDPGECELEVIFDPTFDFSGLVGAIDTLTVTFAIAGESAPGTPNTTQAVLTGTGFISSYNLPDLATSTLAVATVTFCFDGDTGPTFSPEAA